MIYYGVMEIFWKLLMIPTTDEAADAALNAINFIDINHQEKG